MYGQTVNYIYNSEKRDLLETIPVQSWKVVYLTMFKGCQSDKGS